MSPADGGEQRAAAVLRVLADVTSSSASASNRTIIPTDWFQWLPVVDAARLSNDVDVLGLEQHTNIPISTVDRRFGDGLAAIDQIRGPRSSIRVGWLFVAGSFPNANGGNRRVFHPLVDVDVKVSRPPLSNLATIMRTDEPHLTDLIEDPDVRRRLAQHVEVGGGGLQGANGVTDVAASAAALTRMPRLRGFAREAAAAAGFPVNRLIAAGPSADELSGLKDPAVVVGLAVYAATDEPYGIGRAGSLRYWADRTPRRTAAFHSVYGVSMTNGRATTDDRASREGGAIGDGVSADGSIDRSGRVDLVEPVESPLLLTPVQRDVVRTARTAPLTVISGAPGTGKSHTIAAVACDALDRGQTVLICAKSDSTVDALIELLERTPGPDPVVFGAGARRRRLATQLAAGQLTPCSAEIIRNARMGLDAAIDERDTQRAAIVARLTLVAAQLDGGRIDAARVRFPQLFDGSGDLAAVADAAAKTHAGAGWRAERRRTRARRTLLRTVGDPDAPGFADALRVALAHEALIRSTFATSADGLDAMGADAPTGVRDPWRDLQRSDHAVRELVARRIVADSRSAARLNPKTLGAVAALATALRSGRSARREQLRRLDDGRLTSALPLWIGTLAEVDDLLPHVGGLFDLVILDEASAIDQPLAAPTLLRGTRGVVVGDPHQLRHVSFLSDVQLADAVARHGLTDDTVLQHGSTSAATAPSTWPPAPLR